jgi:hypothetical protein
MGRAKEIIVKVIPSKIANEFVKKHHYSGTFAFCSRVHFGAFLDDKLHGVLSYGNPIDKRKIMPLVENTNWNEIIELNRMAFDDYLPKNSESRCLAISFNLIKKNAPQIKWILSFSDGTQCGDGTIYRASGFYLTGIKLNKSLFKMPNGIVFNEVSTRQKQGDSLRKKIGFNLGETFSQFKQRTNCKNISGFQLRYIYLIDKSNKITVPILPFSKIDEMGAGMYKGKKVSLQSRKETCADGLNKSRSTSSIEMAVTPTSAL